MKLLKGMLTLGFLAIFLAGCINIPIGDGKLKITSDGVTVTDEEGAEHDVSFDADNEKLTISGEEGEIAFGGEVDLPEVFPDDIPLAADAQVIAATDVQNSVSVTYGTAMNVGDVDQLYADYFQSNIFEEASDMMMTSDGMTMTEYGGKRPDGRLHVTIQGKDDAEELTTVLIIFDGSGEGE